MGSISYRKLCKPKAEENKYNKKAARFWRTAMIESNLVGDYFSSAKYLIVRTI